MGTDRKPKDTVLDRLDRAVELAKARRRDAPSKLLGQIADPEPFGPDVAAGEALSDTTNESDHILALSNAQLVALVLTLEDVVPSVIAQTLSISTDTLDEWREHPAFAHQRRKVFAAVFERVTRGEFGVVPMAKANAELMMQRLINLSGSQKQETARRAATDILALAGHTPIRKAEIVNVNKIIDAMEPHELREFVEAGKVPARFRDQLGALGVNAGTKKAIDVVSTVESDPPRTKSA